MQKNIAQTSYAPWWDLLERFLSACVVASWWPLLLWNNHAHNWVPRVRLRGCHEQHKDGTGCQLTIMRQGNNDRAILTKFEVVSYDIIWIALDLIIDQMALYDATQVPGDHVRSSTVVPR